MTEEMRLVSGFDPRYSKPITADQIGCARCDGEGHSNITYQPLTFPIDFGDGWIATHWAPCPTSGEPILYCVGPELEE